VQNQDAARVAAASNTWSVMDASGAVVATKTSEIAAKLAAARIAGGTWKKDT
jgi:hypothetical protein